MNVHLCPSQQRAFEGLATSVERGPVCCLRGAHSRGKSTVLRSLFARTGGAYLTAREYVEAGLTRDPLALEESFFALVLNKIERGADWIYLDDLGRLSAVLLEHGANPRRGFFELALKALAEHVIARGRKLIYEENAAGSREAGSRAFAVEIGPLAAEDYKVLGGFWLGKEKAALVDFQQIFRFAPRLDIHQLNKACQWMFHEKNLSTAAFNEYVRENALSSNVDLHAVPQVDLRQLEGLEQVVRGLAAQVVLPLENDQAVKEFSLRPKRALVLYGPPGTGKTAIARALAHRLKSKFVKVDGAVFTGSGDSRRQLDAVIDLARANAPSVLFIDDADRLFENAPAGACSHLVARLNGMDGAAANGVSLVVTAQHPERLPRELLVSGLIESWLETRIPSSVERGKLFQDQLAKLGDSLRNVDPQQVLSASEGFSAVEVMAAVEEAKALFAYDRLQSLPARPATNYLLEGVALVSQHRQRASARADSLS